MCGIAGLQTGADSVIALQAMLGAQQHRGPDDSGIWSGAEWTLGMVRLAIIDVEHGKQPMISRDGRWVVVQNGEIYNYRALQARIPFKLRTTSDTEVLLEMIAHQGVPQTLESIEGMFAFAAVEIPTGKLWLARDRFGEKPLFLDRRSGGFAFASELQPLLSAGGEAQIDPGGLAGLLRCGFPWPGTTTIKGITELLPAHWLCRTRDGQETTGAYWTLPDRIDDDAGSLEKCGERVLELLDASVRDRLIADVPLGLFLSGGIDSGAVAASAVRSRPDIEAVTVGFDAAGYDERPLARKSAAALRLRMHEESGAIGGYDSSQLDDLVAHYGEPFTDTSAVPTRTVSHAARRHFKVVLSGDGGDELFSGYVSHDRDLLLARYGGGTFGAKIAGMVADFVPTAGRGAELRRALQLNAARPQGLLPITMNGVFDQAETRELFANTPGEREAERQVQAITEESRTWWNSVSDSQLAMSLHAIRTSMVQDILMKVDRMSMVESLEVRAPFLDSKLASYALSLPSHLKRRGRLGKYILRHALRGRLPSEVLHGPKRGFSLPVRKWMGERFWRDLHDAVEDYANSGGGELNVNSLRARVERDRARCAKHNDYRALHRAFVLHAFLRWRRKLNQVQPLESLATGVGA
jgi:asparagine synthase (glutamine-hydrolysing)